MFFIGSYRDNEVSEDHIVHGFLGWLSNFGVPVNSVQLGGLGERDVNFMVSYCLGIFPRLCESLSRVVERKTKGNPFFIQTFLSSLADKQLLQYNLRVKRWEWDIDEILDEDITPNVLDLISAKMNELSEDIRVIISLVPFSSRARYLTDFIFVPNIFTLHILFRPH